MLESRSFDAYKNVTAPIIAMLGHSEIDTEVSDISMKTTNSDNCREMSRDDRDANGVLAMTWERARFFCKDRWKFIDPFA